MKMTLFSSKTEMKMKSNKYMFKWYVAAKVSEISQLQLCKIQNWTTTKELTTINYFGFISAVVGQKNCQNLANRILKN